MARRDPRHGRAVPGRRVHDGRAAAAQRQGGRLAGRRRLVQVRAGQAESLAAERTRVAAALTCLSELELACEEAYCEAEAAQARLAELPRASPRPATP